MSSVYNPNQLTAPSTLTVPSEGDAATAASVNNQAIKSAADIAQVSKSRQDVITLAACKALTGMPDGTVRTVNNAAGNCLGSFKYNSSAVYPRPYLLDKLIIAPNVDPGYWEWINIGQLDGIEPTFNQPAGFSSSHLTGFSLVNGTISVSSQVAGIAQTSVSGSSALCDQYGAFRRATLESVTIVWLPATGRAAVPAYPTITIDVNHISGGSVVSKRPIAAVAFGPSDLAGWNAGVVRSDVVLVNVPSSADWETIVSPVSLCARVQGEFGPDAVTGDLFLGMSYNYALAGFEGIL